MKLTEDTLVQKTTADYLRDGLGWDSVYAYNTEDFGPNSLLGRENDRDVVLRRDLHAALVKNNPGLPETAYEEAIRQIREVSASQDIIVANKEKYSLLRGGVQVTYRNAKNELVKHRLHVFDFANPTENRFLCVRELWIRGDIYRRRADIVGFVNGIPLVFMECKSIYKDLQRAYDENLSDYRDTIPHAFHHNAIIIIGNGDKAKLGSVTSKYKHYYEWKRLAEEDPGIVDMETLLKGVLNKTTFLDLLDHFILFDESSGKTAKIIASNHQYLGVNRAIQSLRERKERGGKLGVFWHTQGSGKSYSMVFFTRKIHRAVGGNYTFVVCTDRDDLDTQIYKTFAGCGIVDNDRDPCRASNSDHLETLLGQHKRHIFTLIQKFNKRVDKTKGWSLREDIVVISDEAHRTQYGTLSLNMRDALPNASFIGFTGTPLFKEDEITKKVFGDYISTYDFQRAVEDGATVPLFYDARGDKLGIETTDLNEKIADALEKAEIEDVDIQQRLEGELKREYHIITAQKRLAQVARDFVWHYSTEWETGKAMIVCIDKVTCVRLYELILPLWEERITELERELTTVTDEQDAQFRERQLSWMRQTRTAVVVSEEQGEVEKFRKWELDIKPHRKLIKDGFEPPTGERLNMEDAFKRDDHPFRIVIVCAMWLTGFDVPNLATLYLDKPLKAHTLMQAIARANRVHEGKNNGLIVDYCGILKNLRKALARFAGQGDTGHGGSGGEEDPTHPEEELLESLAEAIGLARAFLTERGASLDAIMTTTGFTRNAAIVKTKEAANENDETRKRFEVMCRAVFVKFRSCITMDGVRAYRDEYDALKIIYKSLDDDRQAADITDIIKTLHGIVDAAITTNVNAGGPSVRYDISKIDFERLRQEFSTSTAKRTTVQNLRQAIENRLQRLIAQNPLRTNFQAHYEAIVHEYNQEKDRVSIEHTFEQLLRFVQALDEEEQRAIREGLDKESVVIFDLLNKASLNGREIARIKQVAVELLATLKDQQLRVNQWRDKEATRDAVRSTIFDFLYSDNTGLPETYTDEEIKTKAENIFQHVFYAYPTLPSPIYGAATNTG